MTNEKRERDRRYYLANRERLKEAARRYREENPEKVSEGKRRWYETHREHVAEKGRKYRADHPGRPQTKAKRRAAAVARDGRTCYLCGRECTDWTGRPTKTDLTLDHVIPPSKGGTHAADNLRVCCRSCNAAKGAS